MIKLLLEKSHYVKKEDRSGNRKMKRLD